MTLLARARNVLLAGRDARVFPSAVAEVGRLSGPVASLAVGSFTYDSASPLVTVDTVYDLASLTKVLATTTLTMQLVERGHLDLAAPLGGGLPGFDAPERAAITVRDLLEHTSGLPAHRPYYRALRGRDAFEAAIVREPLEYEPHTRSIYSDLGFMLLGFILEDAGGEPLDMAFDRWRDEALGSRAAIVYGPVPPEDVAPTEQDAWRQRLLQGEVHDENTAALGGVAGHAGLFGNAAAVGAAARWWMGLLAGESFLGVSADLARTFATRSAVPGSSRALGWDTMLPTSSCGARLSRQAIGHTGFTGTSLWIDPEQDLYVVLLTNRVHPTREGDGIRDVRRAFHDAVIEDLAHPD